MHRFENIHPNMGFMTCKTNATAAVVVSTYFSKQNGIFGSIANNALAKV